MAALSSDAMTSVANALCYIGQQNKNAFEMSTDESLHI